MANKEFKDIAELEAFIDAIATKLTKKHLKGQLKLAGNMVRNVIEESFDNETDPATNQKWEELKESTKLRKLKKGKSSKILRSDGALASNWEMRFTDMAVEVYNDSTSNGFPYGMSHATGSDNLFGKGIKMPSRNFLPIDFKTGDLMDELQDEVANIMLEYIRKTKLK